MSPPVDPEFAALMRAGASPRTFAFPGRTLFGVLFAPAFLLLMLAPWVSRGARGLVWTSASAGRTSLVIAGAMFATWVFEQLYPAERSWNARLAEGGLRRLWRDLVYLIGVTQLTAVLITAIDLPLHRALHGFALWPSHAPFAVRVALAFFGIELCSYWIHRAAHHSRLLWQFHSTHHVITELNAFKSVRTHPIDNLVFHVGRLAPLLLLGAGAGELAAAIYLGAVLGILSHANLELREGLLGLIVNVPRWHKVHHSSALTESRSNFGCHTVLWDRVFGTFRASGEEGVPLGVEPVGPRTLWQELAWPLYRWVSEPLPPRGK